MASLSRLFSLAFFLAFLLAFNRPAEKDEREVAETLIAEHGLPAFCRALLNTNELIYLD